jgi:hypothetical protein
MPENEDKQSNHTTMKTKKRSDILSLCKGKDNFTDEVFSGMWLPFIPIKGNYCKNLLFESLIHILCGLRSPSLLL